MRISRAALVAAIVVGALAGCSPATVLAPSESPSLDGPTAEPTETIAPPVDEEEPEPTGLSDDDYANIAESISSGNTAAIEGYLANPVNFIIAASECCEPLSPIDAIGGLDYAAGATGPWSYPVPEATVDGYRDGFYADYFPDDAFVMMSSDADPFVVSFDIEGEKIVGVFISAGESLLLP